MRFADDTFFVPFSGAESQKQPTPEVSWSDNFKMAGSMTLPARPKQVPSVNQAKGKLTRQLQDGRQHDLTG